MTESVTVEQVDQAIEQLHAEGDDHRYDEALAEHRGQDCPVCATPVRMILDLDEVVA